MHREKRLGFTHKFIASSSNRKIVEKGRNEEERKIIPTLLLLHGTGGNEEDLIPIGHEISSEAAILSPRGKVLENGVMPRFFRRLAEGVFDIEDLMFRTNELADFVKNASKFYGFDMHYVVVVGYSNGANIACSMLLLRPEVVSAAILFRPMVPFQPDVLPDLGNKHIFMSSGRYDPIVPQQEVERLFNLFKKAGAETSLNLQDAGHELSMEEVKKAKKWISSYF